MLALINDVTAPEDREEAVGLYYAANNFMSLTRGVFIEAAEHRGSPASLCSWY